MYDICNNRVFRVDGKFIIVNNVFGLNPRLLQAESLDETFETVYQVQTAKDCIDTFAGLVDKGILTNVTGRTHFNAEDGKLVIELQGVNTEITKEPVEEKTSELGLEKEPEKKTKKSKKENK